MKDYTRLAKQTILSVLVQRVAGWMIDQYVMPLVEKLPTKKKRPFGFANDRS